MLRRPPASSCSMISRLLASIRSASATPFKWCAKAQTGRDLVRLLRDRARRSSRRVTASPGRGSAWPPVSQRSHKVGSHEGTKKGAGLPKSSRIGLTAGPARFLRRRDRSVVGRWPPAAAWPGSAASSPWRFAASPSRLASRRSPLSRASAPGAAEAARARSPRLRARAPLRACARVRSATLALFVFVWLVCSSSVSAHRPQRHGEPVQVPRPPAAAPRRCTAAVGACRPTRCRPADAPRPVPERPGADRGHGAWAWRFDHPFLGGGVLASQQRVRARRGDPASAQLRGGGSLASALVVGRAGGHALARAGDRRPGRPGADLHPLARLGARPRCRVSQGEGATVEGRNDFGTSGYRGPCPPPGHGRHRYSFRLYALDSDPELRPGAGKRELERALEGHTLATAELIGTYER